MACETKTCCFVPSGKIYTRPYDDCCWEDEGFNNPHPWKFIGNASDFSVDASVTTTTQRDYTSCAGGTYCSISQIDEISASFTLYCMSAENMAIASAGDLVEVAANTISNDAVPFRNCGGIIPFTDLQGNPVQGVVTDSVSLMIDGQTLVLDIDYELTGNGISLICESGTVQGLLASLPAPVAPALYTAGHPMTISFSHTGYTTIDLFTKTSGTYEVMIAGENAANECEPFTEFLCKAKIAPATGVSLITGGEFAQWEVTMTIEKDACKDSYGSFNLPA